MSINFNYPYYSNNENKYSYVPRSREEAEAGFILASIASAAVMGALPYFSKPFAKQMKNEHSNNHLYKDAFFKAIDKSGLAEKGLELYHLEFTPEDLIKLKAGRGSEIAKRDIKAGMNACYIPDLKCIKLNINKASISGFHELGHAVNHLQSKTGRFLQKMRKPGYIVTGLMGYLAVFSRKKPKEEDTGVLAFLQNNCGKIAFLGVMPTVIEEALATHQGVKLAKSAGLENKLVKNLKIFYGKAWLSYLGYAIASGLSVFAASKITEIFTRPKKVENPYYF